MWAVLGKDIQMTAGDFGIQLPITISGTTLSASDEILFTLKNYSYQTVLTKTFSNISQNTVNLTLTAQESEGLTPGIYTYILDWYQDGVFMCNLVPGSVFKVVAKA